MRLSFALLALLFAIPCMGADRVLVQSVDCSTAIELPALTMHRGESVSYTVTPNPAISVTSTAVCEWLVCPAGATSTVVDTYGTITTTNGACHFTLASTNTLMADGSYLSYVHIYDGGGQLTPSWCPLSVYVNPIVFLPAVPPVNLWQPALPVWTGVPIITNVVGIHTQLVYLGSVGQVTNVVR